MLACALGDAEIVDFLLTYRPLSTAELNAANHKQVCCI